MKKFLLILLGTLITLPALARDFEYTYEGQTLKYSVLDEDAKTCKTKDGDLETPGNNISGALIIPPIANGYTVTEIGNYSFASNSFLTSVNIPNSVTSIDEYAFADCSGLNSVTIPNSVTSIGKMAFVVCCGLTSVEIPASVSSIGEWAFGRCSSLIAIEVSLENPSYASLSGVLFNKDLSTLIQFPGGRVGDYEIPASVTSIGASAFSFCSVLNSVLIPNSVTSIEDYAFRLCTGLTSVEIGNSVNSIGEYAFTYCESLSSVVIPNSVVSIGRGAFAYCSGLISVTIPTSVTSINNSVFLYCTSLTSVTIPNTITSIDSGAFRNCSALKLVEIPNSVTYIGVCSFDGCSGLTSVTVPPSVTHIGMAAFSNCSGLTSVYYGADEPIEGSPSMFDGAYENATLYMSEKGIVKGRNTIPWMYFANIEVYDFDGIEAVDADSDTDKPCEVYSISGAKVGNTTESLAPGVYIVRQGNAAKKITVK